jgi:hypothetical protein
MVEQYSLDQRVRLNLELVYEEVEQSLGYLQTSLAMT